MQKKGLVYRATMSIGFVGFFAWTGYEIYYSTFYKTMRNKELEEEK